MKQKVKSEAEASLDKTSHTATKSSSSSTHSQSITNSIKPPSDSSPTASNNAARVSKIRFHSVSQSLRSV